MVDLDAAYFVEKGEVDSITHILLVVRHQFQQLGVVIAGKGECSVVFMYEPYRRSHFVCGESYFDATEVELAHESVGYSISMQDGSPHS